MDVSTALSIDPQTALKVIAAIGPAVLIGVLTQALKSAVSALPGAVLPVIDIGLGIVLGLVVLVLTTGGLTGPGAISAAVIGVIWGLTAAGGYDVVAQTLHVSALRRTP